MKTSAGILLYRWRRGAGGEAHLEVLLAHPGGPLWAHRDAGAWSIPKGEAAPGEDPAAVARREFAEETGHALLGADLSDLGEVHLRSGKVVRAWACAGDLDPATSVSNTFSMEWPPHSGQMREFPEVDRVTWFDPDEARRRLNPGQVPLLDRLLAIVGGAGEPDAGRPEPARAENRGQPADGAAAAGAPAAPRAGRRPARRAT